MGKTRLETFADAVLAIVMTILVLGLDQPEDMTLKGLWAVREGFFAYALSFFWLGAMWINIHNEWQAVRKVDTRSVWLTLVMLFFSSLFPYATSIISGHFGSTFAQVFYGVVVFCVTFANMAMYRAVERADPENVALSERMARRGQWARADIAIKVVGLVVSVVAWPPAMCMAVLVTLLAIVIPNQLRNEV